MAINATAIREYYQNNKRKILIAGACFLLLIAAITTFMVMGGANPNKAVQAAIAQHKKAVQADPHDPNLRVSLALTYFQGGQVSQAISELKTALSLDENHQGARLLLADIYMSQKRYKEAIPNYEIIVAANPVDKMQFPSRDIQSAYFQLGSAYFHVDDFKNAANTLQGALMIDGTDSDAWYLLGQSFAKTGELDKAVAAYQKAVLFVPDFKEAYQGMAECFDKLGEASYAAYARAMVTYSSGAAQAAIPQLEKVTAEKPEFIDGFLGLALAYEKTLQKDKATAAYEKVLLLDPENWLAKAKLGR